MKRNNETIAVVNTTERIKITLDLDEDVAEALDKYRMKYGEGAVSDLIENLIMNLINSEE
jgi:metal-responsive CopG/Arc/MetJ family transcriptional regulator